MRGVWIAALLVGCGHVAPSLPAFRGPGQLLLILERDGRRELGRWPTTEGVSVTDIDWIDAP